MNVSSPLSPVGPTGLRQPLGRLIKSDLGRGFGQRQGSIGATSVASARFYKMHVACIIFDCAMRYRAENRHFIDGARGVRGERACSRSSVSADLPPNSRMCKSCVEVGFFPGCRRRSPLLRPEGDGMRQKKRSYVRISVTVRTIDRASGGRPRVHVRPMKAKRKRRGRGERRSLATVFRGRRCFGDDGVSRGVRNGSSAETEDMGRPKSGDHVSRTDWGAGKSRAEVAHCRTGAFVMRVELLLIVL